MRPSSSCSIIFLVALTLPYFCSSALMKFAPVEFLAAHNALRAAVNVSPMRWNKTVAEYAQNYANTRAGDCRMEHSQGPYGENIALGFPLTPREAVNLWLEEKSHYEASSNTCVNDPNQCLHYTQMVWRQSDQLGCGCAKCDNSFGVFVVCSYYPPGNVIGERPY